MSSANALSRAATGAFLGYAEPHEGACHSLRRFYWFREGRNCSSTTVASTLPVWSSPGRVWEGRIVDVCCDLVRVAGGLGTRVGGAQGADRTRVRQGRNTGDRRSLSRWLVVRGRAQNRLAPGRAGGA